MTLKTNVTKVQFNKLQYLQIKPLTQYDKGQVIEFLDDYIVDGTEVQFGNANTEESKNRIIKDKRVEIPDELLESPYQIYAWVKIVTTDSETTVKALVIPIQARVKPSGIVTPANEPSLREEILKSYNEIKGIAQSVRDDADAGKFNGEKGDRGEKGNAYEIDEVTGKKYKLRVIDGELYIEEIIE